jgi:Transglycosylase SLT domain
MRSPSPDCRRGLLLAAMLLLGVTGALGARAASLPPTPTTDPGPLQPPAAPERAAALLALPATPRAGLLDEARVCQALTEGPAGAAAIAAGGAGAAEFGPPIAGALGWPGAGSGAGGAGHPGSVTPEPPARAPLAPAPLEPAAGGPAPDSSLAPAAPSPGAAGPAAAAPKPAPVPHPALGFDVASGVPPQPFGSLIYQVARSYALNPLLVAAIAKVESDFNPRARSRKGACGLMQVLPSTARRFGLHRRRDLFNPRKNLEAATRYLRWLVDRFGDDPVRVLAAYNAGEGAVDHFGGVPPFAETRDYVQRIFGLLGFTLLLDPPAATPAPADAIAAALSALAGAR